MVAKNLKKQLALAVRSIQWSYTIFWTVSANQTGVLEWGEGYYNGDIKTRKTSQVVELNSDEIGFQRSEQLKELYESLAIAEANPQAKRPSAALSPEDLTDTEWYYLVCMSFVFNIGQGDEIKQATAKLAKDRLSLLSGAEMSSSYSLHYFVFRLPGRTLACGQPIWLYNAPCADSRVFSRSLLAKSASIQTVACFPFLDGVIELGATDLVSENLSLIQHIRTSFLDVLDSKVPKKSGAALNRRNDKDDALDHDAFDIKSTPEVGCEVPKTSSPNSSSNAFEANQADDEAFMVEGLNGGASQFHSWQVLDDELSNCVHNSMNSSDCISQTLASPVLKSENPIDLCAQECNNTKMDLHSDHRHYQTVVSILLKSSDQLIMGPCFQNSHQESSFVSWKKEGLMGDQRPRGGSPQKVLKKILFQVPRMHMDGLLESLEENDYKEGMKPEADENGMNHVLSERRRRAKLNERFLILRSIIPSISKDDKISILDDAIEYLRKLEKRIRELEARRELIDLETRSKRTPQDMVERTSDNYFNNKTDNGKKPMKRKACDIDETGPEIDLIGSKDTCNVTMNKRDNEVLIEMKCSWREGALLEIMEAVRSLHLDFLSVQSSKADGNLCLTIKSKFRGSTVVSTKKIKQALHKVACKY